MSTEKQKNIGEQTHTKRNWKTIKLNLLIFAVALIFIAVHEILRTHPYFPVISSVSTIVFIALTLLFCWKWYKSLDEFEQQLLNKSSSVGLYSGFTIGMPWIVLQHHGFIGLELSAYILILIMFLISAAYYYGKKFLDK